MSLIRVYNTSCNTGKRLINLSFVSTVQQFENKIQFYKSNERERFFGSFLFMTGGNSAIEEITCTDEASAKKEFEEIKNILEEYYKK